MVQGETTQHLLAAAARGLRMMIDCFLRAGDDGSTKKTNGCLFFLAVQRALYSIGLEVTVRIDSLTIRHESTKKLIAQSIQSKVLCILSTYSTLHTLMSGRKPGVQYIIHR